MTSNVVDAHVEHRATLAAAAVDCVRILARAQQKLSKLQDALAVLGSSGQHYQTCRDLQDALSEMQQRVKGMIP